MIKTRKNTNDSDFDAFQHDKVLAGCGAEELHVGGLEQDTS